MFEAKLKPRLEIILSVVANKMVAIGITANMVTLFGLVVNLIATFYFATGRLVTGGILILFGGSFDMIDGAVARAQRNLRASGALLDSVIDRYSEGFLFLGGLIYFYSLESLLGIILAFSAWFGSILVSYVRARAEGLQVTCKVGLMQRPERIILLGAGTLLQGGTPTQISDSSKYWNNSALYTWYSHTHLTHYRYSSPRFFISRIESLIESEY